MEASTIFRLDASIRDKGSYTRLLANQVEAGLIATRGDATVIRRDIGRQPLPATAWALSASAAYLPPDAQTVAQQEAVALATELADELVRADTYLFAIPLYNWGISEHVKTWVDLVMTDPRFGPRVQTIPGRSAVLVVARGGAYGPGTPRDGWDHATPWLMRIFVDVWGLDVHLIETELTLAPERETMADLRPAAAQNLAQAEAAARVVGRALW